MAEGDNKSVGFDKAYPETLGLCPQHVHVASHCRQRPQISQRRRKNQAR